MYENYSSNCEAKIAQPAFFAQRTGGGGCPRPDIHNQNINKTFCLS